MRASLRERGAPWILGIASAIAAGLLSLAIAGWALSACWLLLGDRVWEAGPSAEQLLDDMPFVGVADYAWWTEAAWAASVILAVAAVVASRTRAARAAPILLALAFAAAIAAAILSGQDAEQMRKIWMRARFERARNVSAVFGMIPFEQTRRVMTLAALWWGLLGAAAALVVRRQPARRAYLAILASLWVGVGLAVAVSAAWLSQGDRWLGAPAELDWAARWMVGCGAGSAVLGLGALRWMTARSAPAGRADWAVAAGALALSTAAFVAALPNMIDLIARPELELLREASTHPGPSVSPGCVPDESAMVMQVDGEGRLTIDGADASGGLDAVSWRGARRARITGARSVSLERFAPALEAARAHGVREVEVWRWAHETARSARYGPMQQRLACIARVPLDELEPTGMTLGELSDRLALELD